MRHCHWFWCLCSLERLHIDGVAAAAWISQERRGWSGFGVAKYGGADKSKGLFLFLFFFGLFFWVLTRSRLKWDCLPFIHVTIASGHWSLTVIEQSVPGSALVRVRLKPGKPGAHSHLNVYHT